MKTSVCGLCVCVFFAILMCVCAPFFLVFTMKLLYCLILQRSHGENNEVNKKALQRINMYMGMDHINVNTLFGICLFFS